MHLAMPSMSSQSAPAPAVPALAVEEKKEEEQEMHEGSIIYKMSMLDRDNTPDSRFMQTAEWREAARRHAAKMKAKAG
jgi:hypothetical protein